MSSDFSAYLEQARNRINAALAQHLGSHRSEYAAGDDVQLTRLMEAMRYCLLIGGKRVRPALVFATAKAVAGGVPPVTAAALDQIACAVEYIHAYSLVHDDLPAMDNDDLRRGSPTCHRAFDEAVAILAGDAMQARAFELLCELPGISAGHRIDLVQTLASAAGPRGMVGGQAIDLGAVGRDIELGQLERMHRLKTGALIRAAVRMGAIVCNAAPAQLADLDRYATAIGLSFQVQDDILDVTADTATLGKQQGADAARAKPTYPSLLGLEAARAKAQALHESALAALRDFGPAAAPLRQLSAYIVERSH